MKLLKLLFIFSISFLNTGFCQSGTRQKDHSIDEYTGNFYAKIDPVNRFVIRKEKDYLTMEILGQGHTGLTKAGKDRFTLNRVRPKTVIEFKRDTAGKVITFSWNQTVPKYSFIRIPSSPLDSSIHQQDTGLLKYTGEYRLSINRYKILQVRIENGHLTTQGTHEGKITLSPLSDNRFQFVDDDLKMIYDFIPDANGNIVRIDFSRTGSVDCIKTNESFGESETVYGFNHPNGFTRGDSLRGKLTPLRTCYDVLFYDLNVVVDPGNQTISGSNKIRFIATQGFDQLQIDLFASMKIEKILFHNNSLAYRREFNAVFISFPTKVEKGTIDELKVVYGGKPQVPDQASLAGGVLWLQDKDGQYWIETVTQGSGASLWWPCKDHLSDKPDSMKISVTVPRGLTDISNGRFLRKLELPDDQTRFDWVVSYPITNYCVALNIGHYAHFSDRLVTDHDTLALNYYCMSYNVNIAKRIFEHTKPMLSVFEKGFGNYPFRRDGFTAMESIYPMEHQGAVSIGSIFNPFNSDQYDSLDLIRTLWHESAHEWWGNNVTVKDMADLWIHEAFATYAEVLAYEKLSGEKAAVKYLHDQVPGNKEAIIGKYDVNDFHLGDMYSKGVLMLNTLRNLIDNDSLWFDLLRGIQDRFRYQTITTTDIVNYINFKTRTDYDYFFNQYLRHAAIPELEVQIKKEGNGTLLHYKWNSEVEGFAMPIRVTTSKNAYSFIYPTKDWKVLELRDMKIRDFKVATDKFYVLVKGQ